MTDSRARVRPPTGTVTFLFTDVEGSTRLWAANRDGMSASLAVHDALLRTEIETNGGYVFTTAGDSFAAAFARPTDAIEAAAAIQRSLSTAPWPGPELKVRIGIHLGEAEERDGDYFGPVVITTAAAEFAGHGGQTLITETVRLAVSSSDVTDLGMHYLRDIAEPIHLYQLGSHTFPPLRVVDKGRSNLPARPTRLIGRSTDIANVRQLLTASRLVTITAVGGIGKTRVALAVGEEELPHRIGGVWFVDLTAVMHGADLPGAVASALGLRLTTANATQQVVAYLAEKPALIILDNCEHIIDDCAEFASALLTTQGAASILATSREALDIDGEQVTVLAPLPSDSPDSPAVRLFADLAFAVDPAFELNDGNALTVTAICARLDGMPLAIELAAARIPVMNPVELLAGLDHRFQLLSGGRRRQRQRTLEATLDWSYDLLDEDEQRFFRALGVFVDGFDVDAAAAVTNSTRTDGLGIIGALTAKSLVVRADVDDKVRFRLLETVKAYAEDRLVDAEEAADVRGRHLDHYHGVAMTDGRVFGDDLRIALRLRPDRSNITSAFQWAATTTQWVRAGELLLGAHGAFIIDGGWIEQDPLFDVAIEHCAPIDRELTEFLKGCRTGASMQNADPRLLPQLLELQTSPVGVVRAYAFSALALAGAFIGASSPELIAGAEAAWALLGGDLSPADEGHKTFLFCAHGVVAATEGDYQRCRNAFEQALALSVNFPACSYLAITNEAVALCEVLLGDPHAALAAEIGVPQNRMHSRGDFVRAVAHLALGDLSEATVEIRGHAEHGASGRLPGEASDTLFLLAALSRAEGDVEHARRLLSQVGIARTPAGAMYGDHLARELGMLDDHIERKRNLAEPTVQQVMDALRAELTRRGWL